LRLQGLNIFANPDGLPPQLYIYGEEISLSLRV
jgi:hypothetical protein